MKLLKLTTLKDPEVYNSNWFLATYKGMGTDSVDRSVNLSCIQVHPIPFT